jgi:uncharacterized protein YycO
MNLGILGPFGFLLLPLLVLIMNCSIDDNRQTIQNGDIIFQISRSGQSRAIQEATKSKYSHCGIIYLVNGEQFVFEAVQQVKLTPLDEWIARGENGHYVVKRLKDADQVLTAAVLKKMKAEGERFMGKNYDLTFEWNDDKIYCSELVWKIYKRAAGIEVGKLEKLSDFDLSSQEVKKKIKERYGSAIPKDEIVISPASVYSSNQLIEVISD